MYEVQDHRPATSDAVETSARKDRRRRYEAVLRMMERWQADQSGYEERIWPELVRQIEAKAPTVAR